MFGKKVEYVTVDSITNIGGDSKEKKVKSAKKEVSSKETPPSISVIMTTPPVIEKQKRVDREIISKKKQRGEDILWIE